MAVTVWALDGFGERTIEEISLQAIHKNRRVTFCSKVFHSREAATGKARSPIVEQRVRRTSEDADWTRQQMMVEFLSQIRRSCLV